MKLNNVWDVIPKVRTYVRTHPKQLLVSKIWFSLFFEYQKSKMEFLTIWKNWKMSRMWFWKFSPMCKSTSRRNPRSKNLIFVIFYLLFDGRMLFGQVSVELHLRQEQAQILYGEAIAWCIQLFNPSLDCHTFHLKIFLWESSPTSIRSVWKA